MPTWKKNTESEADSAQQEQVDFLKDTAGEEEAPVEALPVEGDERSEEEAEDPYLFEEGGEGEAEPAPDESGEEEVEVEEAEVVEELTSFSDLALPDLEPDVEGRERGEPDAILLAPPPSIQGERLARAKEAVEGGEVEKAVEIYLDVIRENPANIKARNNLGVLYDEMGSHELALEQLEAARELDPENQEILTNLGAALGAMGQYDEAEREIRHALRLDPENVDI
ncbi:MAG: tetratricopeptide repeat protein, partial [Gemmatimonadetes bacterium]|nr:tetratricopeptide repeat protein [Gemmatimonadota bacterium]